MRYSVKLLLIGLVSLPLGLSIFCVAPFDRYGRLAYALSRLWTRAVIRISGVRIKVKGLEQLDSTRPYIFMANHQSVVDIPALVEALPLFQLRWVAKKELLYLPFFGLVIWAAKHIFVERTDYSKAITTLRKAKQKIASGISVVIFPEGTRNSGGQLLPFKRGGFVLALQSRAPIVPVTINGTGAILPKKDWRISAGEVEVIVGQPIPLEDYRRANLRQLMTRVENDVGAHHKPKMNSMQETLVGFETGLCTESVQKADGRWSH